MDTVMDDKYLENISDLEKFLSGSKRLILRFKTIEDKYLFVDEIIDRFSYPLLKRKEKRVVVSYLKKLTGYKHSQLFRLIDRAAAGKLIRKSYFRKPDYHRKYSITDIKLLEKTDLLHQRLSAPATLEIMRREWEMFHHQEFFNIAQISVSHIDNLRQTVVYVSDWVNGTKSREVPIGKTEKPQTNGNPGAIRVDTVHQRDIYHINAVDEITQWEIVVCVPQICDLYLLPALQMMLSQFPFEVFNFHSDRGSEFINSQVSQMLNRLLVNQTKSRSRHCNDNALVETKNGSVVRKHLGYQHMSKNIVDPANKFYFNFFNPYLNFHRPCGYPTGTRTDFKGRERIVYGQYTTPYEKLKEISQEKKQNFLKAGQTLTLLDTIAYRHSDNEFAALMKKQKDNLINENLSYETIG